MLGCASVDTAWGCGQGEGKAASKQRRGNGNNGRVALRQCRATKQTSGAPSQHQFPSPTHTTQSRRPVGGRREEEERRKGQRRRLLHGVLCTYKARNIAHQCAVPTAEQPQPPTIGANHLRNQTEPYRGKEGKKKGRGGGGRRGDENSEDKRAKVAALQAIRHTAAAATAYIRHAMP